MITAIELQVISRILTSENEAEVDKLCAFDSSYYDTFKPQIEFILDYRSKYGSVPSLFNFQMEFEEEKINLVDVTEPLEFLITELKKNKQAIIFREMFNRVKDQGSADISEVWKYIGQQCDKADMLNDVQPMDIVAQAEERSIQVIEWSQQPRIPTGFPELDKLTYGGLSTVEEMLVIVARTNTGKTWILVKMMEAAQKAGFPVAYYSPEMQAAYLATRFDTWRGHYQNSDLFRGKYTAEYLNYIHKLPEGATPAFIIEDKDMVDGVSPKHLETFVKEHKIKLLIIDGISYMVDDKKSFSDHEKYAHICHDLFQLSKKYGCAIVIAAQANRETKECKDDKGMPFPNIYNIAGSDAIGQIATQVYAVRQIFDKHVLDIRLEKARMAPNENNVLSYSWDVNSGNMQYLPGGADEDPMTSMPSMPESPNIISNPMEPDNSGLNLTDDDDIEF
jgi:replicative DNA helicase